MFGKINKNYDMIYAVLKYALGRTNMNIKYKTLKRNYTIFV